MWKKFLAIMAITGLLSTTSAYALDSNPQPGDGNDNGGVVNYIDNFTVTPATVDLSVGTNATVSFDLLLDANMYVYVINDQFDVVATVSDYVPNTAGAKSLTWNAAGNTSGTYQVRAFATSNGSILDFDYKNVEVVAGTTPPQGNGPVVSDITSDPSVFSPIDNEDTEISFSVDAGGELTVVVEDDQGVVVKTFSDYVGIEWYQPTESHSIQWDGKGDDGLVLADGTYTIKITAKNDDGTNVATGTIQLLGSSIASDGVIEDVTLDPKSNWDPTNEDLEIEFELTQNVKTLTVNAKLGNKVIEIIDDEYADDDDYKELWDGTDDDGDYISEGLWEIIVRADGDKVTKYINVKYEEPTIEEALVTKTSFDPHENEFTNLIFMVDADAVVTVEVYKGSKKEFELVDEVEVDDNRYYSVKWDGTDEDGDDVDYGKDWKFKITAENPTDDDVFDIVYVEVDVEDDDVSNKKSNVTNDSTDPLIADEDYMWDMEFTFCMDADAEIFLAIYDGTTASGSSEVDLLDYVDMDAGCHTAVWNGLDEDDKDLDAGIYSYKIISKVGSYKDTETGRFVVGTPANGSNDYDEDDEDEDDDDDVVAPPVDDDMVLGECSYYYWDMGYMSGNNELCDAVSWVTENGVFAGYPDGSFKAYQNINRAEVLKVVLNAFNVNLFPLSGTSEGFTDVDAYAWYMPFVRTAKFYGMLNGYGDGTVRLENNINRVEFLKLVLSASEAFTGYEFSTGYYYPAYADVPYGSDTAWFFDYANAAYQYELYNTYYVGGQEYLKPSQLVERGEVALLLYRMAKADLL